MPFSEIESAILNCIQADFPLAERPYHEIATAIGCAENEVREAILGLRASGTIRTIAGIFNAESLGYESSLIAFEVPEERIEEAARVINEHPGVSHNYLRDHRFNIWFTLAVDRRSSLYKTAEALAERAGAHRPLILKTEMLYKIGLNLRIGDGNIVPATITQSINPAPPRNLNASEREAVRLLQINLPDTDNPFEDLITSNVGTIDVTTLIDIGKLLQTEGVMRRYAAIVKHQKAGYTANAMTAWKPAPDQRTNDFIDFFIDERAISHLYKRTIYPGTWEYPLFAMIHAHSDSELADIIARLSRASGIGDYVVLRSLKEFKKQRVVYAV